MTVYKLYPDFVAVYRHEAFLRMRMLTFIAPWCLLAFIILTNNQDLIALIAQGSGGGIAATAKTEENEDLVRPPTSFTRTSFVAD